MRYLPHTEADRKTLLAAVGANSIDDLYIDVPAAAHLGDLIDLPARQGELEVERTIAALAAKNLTAASAPSFTLLPRTEFAPFGFITRRTKSVAWPPS